MKDDIKLSGRLEIHEIMEDGSRRLIREKCNLVVTVGKEWVAGAIIGATTYMNAIAVGSSSTPPQLSDIALGAEIGRASATSSASGTVITYTSTFAAGVGTGTWQEAGIFNSASANSGTMLSHTTFSPVTKGSTQALSITWYVTVN